jgi:ComF family protein
MSAAQENPEKYPGKYFSGFSGIFRLNAAAGALARQALEVVYPSSCPVCAAAVQQNGFLCTECWTKTPFIERPYCERSGVPFGHDLGDGLLSPDVMANPPVWNRARAVARYEEGPARRLVHQLKYGDRQELARNMGQWMARAGADVLAGAHLLVPIPLHRRRLFTRRFNQAAALSAAVSRASGAPSDPLALVRVKPTVPQVGLSRAQRADNVQGAFRTPDEARPRVVGRRVVLIDDVMTSGATANACARTLLRAGAEQVDVLVFARVVTGV